MSIFLPIMKSIRPREVFSATKTVLSLSTLFMTLDLSIATPVASAKLALEISEEFYMELILTSSS